MPVLGHVGLALATSLSGLLAATALAAALARRGHLRLPPPIEMIGHCGRLVMAAVLFGIGRDMLPALRPAVELVILVIGGGGAYIIAAMPSALSRASFSGASGASSGGDGQTWPRGRSRT